MQADLPAPSTLRRGGRQGKLSAEVLLLMQHDPVFDSIGNQALLVVCARLQSAPPQNDPGRGAAPARQSDLRLRQEELREDQGLAQHARRANWLSPRQVRAAIAFCRECHLKVTRQNSTAFPASLAFSHHENQHFDTERPVAAVCDRCLIATRTVSGELSGCNLCPAGHFP